MKQLPVTNSRAIAYGDLGIIEVTGQSYLEPLIMGVFGGPGSGKSRLLATAQDPIGLIPTESKARQTVLDIAKQMGKRVFMPAVHGKEISLIRTEQPMVLASLPATCVSTGKPSDIQNQMQAIADKISIFEAPPMCCTRHYYRWHVNRTKYVAYQMADNVAIRTIGFDTFGTFVDDVSMANYGLTGVIDPKEFGFAPREDMIKEIREFLNNLANSKHLILTHHQKEVWRDGAPVKGQYTFDGKFSKLGHYVSIMCRMVRNDKAGDGEPKWTLKVVDCQKNAGLIGLDLLNDGDITFANVGAAVYETDAEEWE